jgi:3alpha(or 20beta)-hydroxysteroid dehydrogenase
MGRLAGKVAIVTGGARGQGEAEVRRFIAEGARVVFGDVLVEEGHALARELGPDTAFCPHDVSDERAWAAVVADAEARFGKVDVLVNNAGIFRYGTPVHETSPAEYRRVIEVNQVGTFLGMRAVVPAMLRNRGGSIVNISSTAGLQGSGGTIAYAASKWAVRGMTKVAAAEYGKAGIRVNSVHPGQIDTVMLAPLREARDPDEEAASYAMTPIPRIGRVDDVVNVVLFLASDEAAYCTGAEFVVDGGRTAGMVVPGVQPLPGDGPTTESDPS